VAREPAAPLGNRSIVDELHAMRDLIEDRFNTFAWLNQAKQHPIQSNLMLKLMRAGYSPTLSRTILEHMPEALGAPDAMQWMLEAIERNLKTSGPDNTLLEEGGIHALVGATGVGKTTTVAKLAGLCARAHGPASVGMITLDTQRMGAHEQLREHARSMGLVAHLAHDRAALQDLLGLFANKRMVLIDTSGLAPRDLGKEDALSVLDLPGVRRLLVLNAGAQGDSLDQVVSAFRSGGVQQAVLSKIDEAVKLGPALDVAIRQQLLLRGVTDGQKVPDDWADADARELVRQSMRVSNPSAFDPKPADLGFYFIQPDSRSAVTGRAHA
jgi:flagellar biosynthesis protein FlhF